MELWREGLFLNSLCADGGEKEVMLEHTHMRCSS